MVLVLKKGANKKEMDNISKKLQVAKGVDTKKYCGTVKLNEDPLVIQKQMRDEWQLVFIRYECHSVYFSR